MNVIRRTLCLVLILSALPLRAAPPGTVVAWGRNDYGQANVPAGLTDVIAIAAGGAHTVALRSNGTVVAWGSNKYGQTDVPARLSQVIAIAAGGYHSVAVKSDGMVVAWGRNDFGQTNVPAGLNGVTAVAAGDVHTVALKTNGTVVAWGSAGYVPAGLTGVTAIAAGGDHGFGGEHAVALKSDGTVVAWGWGDDWGHLSANGFSGVTAIAAAASRTVVLKSDGTVVMWGIEWINNFPEPGLMTGYPNYSGRSPAGLSGITAIAAGDYHTVALKNDGTVVTWGVTTNAPTVLSEVMAIAAGAAHTVALVPSIVIAQQPASQTVNAGQGATFTVRVTGAAPLSYQWLKDGINIPGATAAALTLSNVQRGHLGNYAVVVTNAYDSVTSNLAALTIDSGSEAPPGKLTNFSVRAAVDSRAPTFTVGFVVDGAGTLPVLLRGVGPALSAFGIVGALDDPVLTLFQGSTVLGSNDNWESTTPVNSASAAVGAFSLSVGSRDAVLYHSGLAAGSYTAQIAGKSAPAGIALTEIYDATSSSAPTTARLMNVSARGQIDGSGNEVVAGFIVSDRGSTQLLIRGVGPALARFGVTGAVEDPVLRIYDRAGVLIATNDDWNSDPLLRASFSAVHAFELPAASKDAALLLRVQPGAYTAVLSHARGNGGEGLIEIYKLP